jgi:hypothetical protein
MLAIAAKLKTTSAILGRAVKNVTRIKLGGMSESQKLFIKS